MSKNSLAALKTEDKSKNSLPTTTKATVRGAALGRKAKPLADKAKNPITLKFTDAELEKIQKVAGLTPKATLLKELLLKETSLFK